MPAWIAPRVPENFPAAQAVQFALEVALIRLDQYPGGHWVQLPRLMSPALAPYLPAPQGVHALAPYASEYDPATHKTHVPAADAPVAAEADPGEHAAQVAEEDAPVLAE